MLHLKKGHWTMNACFSTKHGAIVIKLYHSSNVLMNVWDLGWSLKV